MSLSIVIVASLVYISLLFLIAWRVDKKAGSGVSVVDNPYVYALSLAVYCTAWTFFGSVGRAATGGLSFLGVYVGPTLLAPLWYWLLHKMMVISKNQRITSIADFISSRYGKSPALAVVVTLIAVLGIVPYISIQIKAVTFGITTLTGSQHHASPYFWGDAGFYVTLAMAIFTGVFGTRKLDPNERHEGLVAAIAFESLVKLIAFMAVGIFVTFGIYHGFDDLFGQAAQHPETLRLFTFADSGVTAFSWNIIVLLSLFAIILLPRQFHISVVESTSPRHVPKAMWVFPLYLLLINIFVLPLAMAGKMMFDSSVHPDTYVLSLPMSQGANWLALAAFIGGFSAATSMVVIETTALSIMFSNHIVVPVLIKMGRIGRPNDLLSGDSRLLDIRRVSIMLVLLLAWWYQNTVGNRYDLVSVGLISFTAAAQLAPAALAGMFWKRATKQGAMAGLIIGFLVWAYCLPLPGMAQAGIIPDGFLKNGLFGLPFLKPYALFGLTGLDTISHGAFWSLFLNFWAYVIVSVNTQPSTLGLRQADLFTNIHRYIKGQETEILKREAKLTDLQAILNRFLGEARTLALFREFEKQTQTTLTQQQVAHSELINFAETHLAGAIGAASARLVLDSIVKEENITLEEVMHILDQTREAVEHSRVLEAKNLELKELTQQLTEANAQLKTLDRLKADFITTVTHELRTPVTSIKALSKIILDHRSELNEERLHHYLQVIVSESERITRLINQVLDLEKLQQDADAPTRFTALDFSEIVRRTTRNMEEMFREKGIALSVQVPDEALMVSGHADQLVQVIVNLLSNAWKFAPGDESAQVRVTLRAQRQQAVLDVFDNGAGIPKDRQPQIFEKFTQFSRPETGKPTGSGLGLYITKQIVERHGGTIRLDSGAGKGTTFAVSIPLSKE
ncbi:MAG: histidine kinase [Saprospiraceae bacterium]|nr:histidine kinase [Saprospiraceae bacterium]